MTEFDKTNLRERIEGFRIERDRLRAELAYFERESISDWSRSDALRAKIVALQSGINSAMANLRA